MVTRWAHNQPWRETVEYSQRKKASALAAGSIPALQQFRIPSFGEDSGPWTNGFHRCGVSSVQHNPQLKRRKYASNLFDHSSRLLCGLEPVHES